jgi:hypothetical protein
LAEGLREREPREVGAGVLVLVAALAEVRGSTAGGNVFVLRAGFVDVGAEAGGVGLFFKLIGSRGLIDK